MVSLFQYTAASAAHPTGDVPWTSTSGDAKEQRFSSLDDINADNVRSLGLAWYYDIPTHLGQEATPLEVDGTLYVSTDGSIVRALDARTGRELWSYNPHAYSAMVSSCCGVNNRGIAILGARVYVGTLDGRLVALDAKTGRPRWSVMTVDPKRPYTISGAPRIIDGKVIIGNGGAEFGVRGYVTAYDAKTGKQLWRFYTVPGDPSHPDHASSDAAIASTARPTWSGEFWRKGGGGTVWDSMAYDPELHLLYFGVGNGSPWDAGIRSPGGGDNLFLASIVALDPDTGRYVWHYQETPSDEWDYDATQSLILADVTIAGRARRVLMQASKNGFFYVLDAKEGKLLSAEKFAPVNWASRIDLNTGRPLIDAAARYDQGKPALVMPGSSGAHNWQSMAFSPATGLAYIPAQSLPMLFAADTEEQFGPKKTNLNVSFDGATPLTAEQVRQAHKAYEGWLSAWDPSTQREVWRVQEPHFWNGGVLATAGDLVIQGNGAGELVAYGARDGKRLWSFDAQAGIVASPMTFRIGGEQYIVIMVGWAGIMPLLGGGLTSITDRENGPNRVLSFKLGAHEALPAAELTHQTPHPVDAPVPGPPASLERGGQLYSRYCFRCHGIGAVSGGVTPDLRYSPFIADRSAFARVVLDGALVESGMSSFGRQIGSTGGEDIRSYLISRAHQATIEQAAANAK